MLGMRSKTQSLLNHYVQHAMKGFKTIGIKIITLVLLGSLFQSCETEDVYPTVTLTSSSSILAADSGSITIKALLNGPVSKNLNLPLSFTGTALQNVHYSLSGSTIIIPENSSEGTVVITGINTNDTALKFISVSLSQVDKVINLLASPLRIEIVSRTADRDNDGLSDLLDACPDVAGPLENDGCPWLGLIINEVLYDPPDGLAGDSNGDGTRDPNQDEFVELYNANPALNISGYTLSDDSSLRHTFPSGTILPSKGVIVVFGGGNPASGLFGNAQVQKATGGRLNLNNTGDVLTLKDSLGNNVAVFDIGPLSDNPNESYTRNPDITGAFVQHSTVPAANGALFSPGKKNNGSNL